MWIVVGLGNPGPSYAGHRHNIGFMATEGLAQTYSARPWSQKFSARIAEVMIAGEKVLLMQPLTYMNLSGQSVGEAARFYKIPPENIIAIHDELDLPLGKIRVKKAGGAGGHNGIKSLDSHITSNYHRVRIGIDHPGDKDQVSDYVLSNFAKAELPLLDEVLHDIVKHFPKLLQDDAAGFMTACARDLQPAPAKAAAPTTKA